MAQLPAFAVPCARQVTCAYVASACVRFGWSDDGPIRGDPGQCAGPAEMRVLYDNESVRALLGRLKEAVERIAGVIRDTCTYKGILGRTLRLAGLSLGGGACG